MNSRASAIAFIDFLICMVMVFFYMFVVSTLQIAPPSTPSKSVEMKAEFVIELTWPNGSLDDIDLWVKLPDNRRVGFTSKDLGIATLDRDDRGAYGDTFYQNDGTVQVIRINKEVTVIRGILPGRYVVNAHYYKAYTEAEAGVPDEGTHPMSVVGVLTKLNPRTTEVVRIEKPMGKQGNQVTLFAFEVGPAGEVTVIDKDADLPFIMDQPMRGAS